MRIAPIYGQDLNTEKHTCLVLIILIIAKKIYININGNGLIIQRVSTRRDDRKHSRLFLFF